MYDKIMTPGEKIKTIRKQYRIKQHEITGEKITRNLISIIENDKTALTKNTAEIIAENINKLCKEKGISFKVTSEYLLESTEEQAKKASINFMEFIQQNKNEVLKGKLFDELSEIEKVLNKYELKEEKFTIYHTLGDIYKSVKNYHKAYTYYLEAYGNGNELFNNLKSSKLLIKIAFCCNKLQRYNETLDFHKLALIYNDNLPEDLRYVMMFNNVKAYKNLEDYKSAITEINKIEERFEELLKENTTKSFNVLTLKANCLTELKFYNDAILTHKSILKLVDEDDIECRIMVFCNLMQTYIKLNDTVNINKYLNRCLSLLGDYEKSDERKYSADIYSDVGSAFYHIHNFDQSKYYFYKALKFAREDKKIALISYSMDNLISIVTENEVNDIEEVDYLKNLLLELMSINLLPENNLLLLKLISYYNNQNNSQIIDNLIKFTLELPHNKGI